MVSCQVGRLTVVFQRQSSNQQHSVLERHVGFQASPPPLPTYPTSDHLSTSLDSCFRFVRQTTGGVSTAVLSAVALSLVVLSMASGCSQEAPIVTYRIPTKVPVAFAAEDSRMVAAILPQEKQAWFFKIVGRQSAVERIAEQFKTFVEEIEFEDGKPVIADELPENWKRGGSRAMRFASIDINTPEEQLDLSISQLALMDDWDSLVTSNIVRWRKQVGLEATEEKWSGAEKLDWRGGGDTAAVWLDVTGRPASAGPPAMGGAPFASMISGSGDASADPHAGLPRSAQEAIAAQTQAAEAGKPVDPAVMASAEPLSPSGTGKTAKTDSGADAENDDPTSKLKYVTPEGWRDGRMSMMRLAAFEVGDADLKAEITIINAGGDLRGNVARWMGQISETTVRDEEVDAALEAAEKFEINGRSAQRFVLMPPGVAKGSEADEEDAAEEDTAKEEESEDKTDDASEDKIAHSPAPARSAIDATIVPLKEGFSMFIKMSGPAETVRTQTKQMKQFLESIEF